MQNLRLFFGSCATLVVFLVFIQAAALAQPPRPPAVQFISATIQIDKIEPEHPTEGQITTVYVTVTNWLPTPSSGWVSARFDGVPNSSPDSHQRIDALPSKGSVSQAFPIATPHPGESTKIIATFYDREYAKPFGFRQRLLAQAELDIDILHSFVTKRTSGRSYFKLSQPDPHDSASEVNGYLLVTHDPGCGWVGNDGTDRFFADKSLPPGVKIEHTDFKQFWPNERGCGDPWSWLNDAGSYNTKLDGTLNSIRWHNACAGAYNGKNLYYVISFLISMPTGTSLDDTLYDVAETPPAPPSGYSLTEQPQPTTTCSSTPSSTTGTTKRAVPAFDGPYFNPSMVHRNEKFTITYLVANLGNASSDSFDVTLCIDDACEKDTKSVPKLDAGKSGSIQWSIDKDLGASFVHSAVLKVQDVAVWSTQFTTY